MVLSVLPDDYANVLATQEQLERITLNARLTALADYIGDDITAAANNGKGQLNFIVSYQQFQDLFSKYEALSTQEELMIKIQNDFFKLSQCSLFIQINSTNIMLTVTWLPKPTQ